MMKIEKPLVKATIAESAGLAVKMAEVIERNGVDDSFLSQSTKVLQAKGVQMKQAIAPKHCKEKTNELYEADLYRDTLFSALKFFLRGFIRWENSDFQKKRMISFQSSGNFCYNNQT
jgi:hypothetical protein